MLKRIAYKVFNFLNYYLPKKERVLIYSRRDLEGNAVAIANYIAKEYDMPVYYGATNELIIHQKEGGKVIHNKVVILNRFKPIFYRMFMTSKYVFATNGYNITSLPDEQILVNVWHGLLYKTIGKLMGLDGLVAHYTVGTSELSQKMFSEAFGVSEKSVLKVGYPRNDILLESINKRNEILKGIGAKVATYDKIIIWLPTFRKHKFKDKQDGNEPGNPFYITDFDTNKFNNLLKSHNALCILKPHPFAIHYKMSKSYKNIMIVDDSWLVEKDITLYHLLGCSDILISDVSSVIIDYLLMDKPIICISEDFEEYGETRGYYFEDTEKWIPTKVLKTQQEAFEMIKHILEKETDPFEEKRVDLKWKFFDRQDSHSTKRLVERIIGQK